MRGIGMDNMANNRVGVTILLPTLDEVNALPDLIERMPREELRQAGYEPHILVADGRSTDGTQEMARSLGCEVIEQRGGRGKGIGLRQAFDHFLRSGDERLVMLDADGTYYPEDALRLLDHLNETKSDIVMGSRLRGWIEPGALGRVNYIGNHLLTWTAVALHGTFVSDLCTGYWAYKRDAIAKLQLNSVSFEIEAEMYASACHRGLKISEVPIHYDLRIGETKLGSVDDGVRIFRKLLVRRLFPKPVHPMQDRTNVQPRTQ